MADQDGTKDLAIKGRLLKQGERFSFFQAYRLLRLAALKEGRPEADVKVRPSLSLHFPGTDLNDIRETSPGTYRLTANFLGLYGVTSPLPNFYSEQLLDEHHESRHSNRDFLDIISQTIYPLFFRAWLKSRAHVRIKEFNDQRLLEIFHTFVGINEPLRFLSQPGFSHLLRFAGLFSQYPRSAMGLRTIIAALYPKSNVEVIQQDEMWQPIPSDQRMHLGSQACTLGEDSHVGAMVHSRINNLTIRIHDIDQTTFLALLPGQKEFAKLAFIIRYYLLDPLNVRLDLQLRRGAVQPIQLGAPKKNWAALGHDTWLVNTQSPHEAHAQVML
ncbi:MAG: type VI secretion system baseplate subunit TssG [Pusillimonas sp.]|jgi:type VI secretion system protein ImpH|nr:type VI secretion system baseplate subunit TssG [Pusillimonas sp.]